MTLTIAEIEALPYVGDGSTRTVYRDGDIVYKIENENGRHCFANTYEWAQYQQLKDRSFLFNIVIPDMYLITVENTPVIVSYFVDGQPMGDCMCNPHRLEPDHDENCLSPEMESDLVGIDMAWGNVIFDGIDYWVVDL